MANNEDKSKLQKGQEGTTGNDRGMNETNDRGGDMDAGNMQHGTIGGAGFPDNIDSSTDSSSGAGSAGSTGGDIGGGGGTAGSLKGNSSVANDENAGT